jgi:hypothetical protein
VTRDEGKGLRDEGIVMFQVSGNAQNANGRPKLETLNLKRYPLPFSSDF